MTWTDRRRAFRSLLAGSACLHPASVFDPISARIAEDLGFESGMFAGSVAALTVLGAPDLVVITLTEFAEQIRRMTRATARLPLLVDADHGYGNALNVMRTVQELEVAGVAALTIEDTLLPRAYAETRPQLLAPEEGLGKIRAALAARSDPGLVIVARTGALAVSGLDDAVARARLYAEAGADALFFTGVKTLDQVKALHAATGRPLILGGTDGTLPPQALAEAGVRLALQGHHPFMAAVQALHETLAALRAGTPPGSLVNQPPAALMKQLTREAGYAAATRDFLGG
ncbi:Oxaloacetate decarboxylase [Rhodovastum atsumiense]|uniref:Isocitrate lyase/PEP mutase family protein n=1 Tax=Rhodovastum atsumiense TaxID=504468 RepID=A0A5M6IQ77_9PROT|nr:isocitrate lyase/PEP mutase family protein [Rhodovastum atsumiense]KAA5610067.1 isocitrate lyase/PEP mutase family protein [Rhodovastum atsumiense]CAH2601464.1 Oxaloacetate decarboxylase [Rhodovastum atsumiense]